MHSTGPYSDLLQVALLAARRAVAVHRRELGRVPPEQWSEKGAADFVSAVDTAAEAEIVQYISTRFPDHAIIAEEAATAAPPDTTRHAARKTGNKPAPEWIWYIDPLDGTTNYLHQYPMFAASIAVAQRGELVAAAVISGATGEEWTATKGGGACLNGQTISVSRIRDLSQALLGTGFPFKALELLPAYLTQFQKLLPMTAGIRRAGSAAIDLCHVATGYFDGFWELWLAPWDVAAGTLIAREAGATVTTMAGDADVLRFGTVLAGNPAIYRLLYETLRDAG